MQGEQLPSEDMPASGGWPMLVKPALALPLVDVLGRTAVSSVDGNQVRRDSLRFAVLRTTMYNSVSDSGQLAAMKPLLNPVHQQAHRHCMIGNINPIRNIVCVVRALNRESAF
jgi:hypothetical protein